MDILLAAAGAVVLAAIFFFWLDRHDGATYEDVWQRIVPPMHQEVEEARAQLWEMTTQSSAHQAAAERTARERDELREELDGERAKAEEAQQAAEARGALEGRQAVADPLWQLEISRAARRWQEAMGGVGAGGGVPSSPASALVAALGWELERIREEVGVPATLETDVPTWLPPSTALIALRLAQEVVATLVKGSDSLEVRLGTVGVLDGEGGPAVTVNVTCTGCAQPLAEVPGMDELTTVATRLDTKVILDELGERAGLVVLQVPFEA